MQNVFVVTIASILTALIAHSASLDDSLRSIAGDLSNKELAAKEAAKAASTMSPDVLVDESLAFLFASTDAASEAAAVRFLLALERFPFETIVTRFKTSSTSTERAYTLHLLNLGARDQPSYEVIKKLSETVLYDNGTGLRRYGEARAYSSEGKRVCDVAYNILVSKLGLEAVYPLIDADNYATIQRDQMIEKLGVELKLPKPASWNATTQNTGGTMSPAASAAARSSMSWSVISMLIIAATGLLWLLVKKRK